MLQIGDRLLIWPLAVGAVLLVRRAAPALAPTPSDSAPLFLLRRDAARRFTCARFVLLLLLLLPSPKDSASVIERVHARLHTRSFLFRRCRSP